MSRNLPYVRVPDIGTYPTQLTIGWFINGEKLIGAGSPLAGNEPNNVDVMNRQHNQNLHNIERVYDLTAIRGDTASRPTTNRHQYFDTDLGKPIWWNGTYSIYPSCTIPPNWLT